MDLYIHVYIYIYRLHKTLWCFHALGTRLHRYLWSSVHTATTWYINALPRRDCDVFKRLFLRPVLMAPPQRPGFGWRSSVLHPCWPKRSPSADLETTEKNSIDTMPIGGFFLGFDGHWGTDFRLRIGPANANAKGLQQTIVFMQFCGRTIGNKKAVPGSSAISLLASFTKLPL